MYIPTSPAYNPTSPAYDASTSYNPTHTGNHYSPIREDEEEDEEEKKKE
jgi:hypothetical protein